MAILEKIDKRNKVGKGKHEEASRWKGRTDDGV